MIIVPAGAAFLAYLYDTSGSVDTRKLPENVKVAEAMAKNALRANALLFVGISASVGYGVYRLSGVWSYGLIGAGILSVAAMTSGEVAAVLVKPLTAIGFNDATYVKDVDNMADKFGADVNL